MNESEYKGKKSLKISAEFIVSILKRSGFEANIQPRNEVQTMKTLTLLHFLLYFSRSSAWASVGLLNPRIMKILLRNSEQYGAIFVKNLYPNVGCNSLLKLFDLSE
jgi:hypothetical protein